MNAININVSLPQIIEIIKQLSPSEKLQINEAIWDDKTQIPLEHQLLVMERMEKSKKNPKRMLNWDEISNTL